MWSGGFAEEEKAMRQPETALLQHPYCYLCTFTYISIYSQGFPGGSDGKESACDVGDLGSIHGLGRLPGEGLATHSSILAWRIPWMGSLVACFSLVLKETSLLLISKVKS